MIRTIYIGVGTNIEPRLERMKQAFFRLRKFGRNIAYSSMYESEPVGYSDQPDFLNAVVKFDSDMEAVELHSKLKALEIELGRQERERWHEREIDFDILFFGGEVISTEELSIPHPSISERVFVLVPLVELAPTLKDPVTSKSMSELLSDLGDRASSIHVFSQSHRL